MPQLALEVRQGGYTVISNDYIDHYMYRANGEFVKIYLCLLRCSTDMTSGLSLASIADRMNMTESDVMRALRYWEQEELLEINTDESGQLSRLTLVPPRQLPSGQRQTDTDISTFAGSPDYNRKTPQTDAESAVLKSQKQTAAAVTPPPAEHDDADLAGLLLLAEQYLGRTLSPMDANRITYFYKDLHFSVDLIEYLFEHCVTIGNRNIRYIESVAISWKDRGITTVEQAKAEGSHYRREYFAILKAFGITGRSPIDLEVDYMKKWLDEYHFTPEVIAEACQRTIAKTGKPVFTYADSILKNWKEHGILAKRDIAALDAAHYARSDAARKNTGKKDTNRAQSRPASRFNNFDQRDYDFNELERTLNQL